MSDVFAIRGWDRTFECSESRKHARLHWFQMPNSLDSDGYCELMLDPEGAAHYGVWCALLALASRCEPRGVLVRKTGEPHNAATVANILRIPSDLVARAWERFRAIGWLETPAQWDSKPQSSGKRNPKRPGTKTPTPTNQPTNLEPTNQPTLPTARAEPDTTALAGWCVHQWNATRRPWWFAAECLPLPRDVELRLEAAGSEPAFRAAFADRLERAAGRYTEPIPGKTWRPSLRWLLGASGWQKAGEALHPSEAALCEATGPPRAGGPPRNWRGTADDPLLRGLSDDELMELTHGKPDHHHEVARLPASGLSDARGEDHRGDP